MPFVLVFELVLVYPLLSHCRICSCRLCLCCYQHGETFLRFWNQSDLNMDFSPFFNPVYSFM